MLPQPWEIGLLGGLCLRLGPHEVSRFRTQKTAALLAYLALFPQPSHPREVLLDILWPDSAPDAARNSLSVALSSLRRQLEPPGIPSGSVLLSDRTHVRLNPAGCATDVGAFLSAVAGASSTDDPAVRAGRLTEALGLYRGDLLPGFYDEWVLPERERLVEACLQAHLSLADALQRLGQTDRALEYAHRAVARDPLREDARRVLMRLLQTAGNPSAARQQFRDLARGLREELDAAPSAETVALARSLGVDLTGATSKKSVSPAFPRSAAPLPSPVPDKALTVCLLPPQFTRFFGREREVADLCQCLLSAPSALATVTGPGGTGKTRLALAVAERLHRETGRPVWFVPLADVSDPAYFPETLRETLRLPEAAAKPALEQVIALLTSLPCLLVLDNFEHLADGGAALVHTLRERLPDLACLVTSRTVLGLPGEQDHPLSPLPTPSLNGTPERLLQCPSVQLLADRSRARRPDFAVTPRNAAAIAALCIGLEGIPLALELAASWAGALTPAQMASRLSSRLDWLTTTRRDVPARHWSLRAVLDESFRLLPDDVGRFFARLSVFRGGWTPEAAASVCEEPEALALLDRLAECSLVMTQEVGEARRFGLLETLREFTGEHLAADEFPALAARHAAFFIHLAEEGKTAQGAAWEFWLDRMEPEQENPRAALRACGDGRGETGQELRLAESCWKFWAVRGRIAEGRAWLAGALERAPSPSPRRTEALLGAGCLAWLQADYPAAESWLRECLAAARTEDAPRMVALALLNLGNVAAGQGRSDQAWERYEECLSVRRALGEPAGIASALNNLGDAAYWRGDLNQARALLAESLEIGRRHGDRYGVAVTLSTLAGVETEAGDLGGARACLQECSALVAQIGDPRLTALVLEHAAALAQASARLERAVSLWGAAARLREQVGAPASPVKGRRLAQALAACRASLGAQGFSACWEHGQSLEALEAVAAAAAEVSAEIFAEISENGENGAVV